MEWLIKCGCMSANLLFCKIYVHNLKRQIILIQRVVRILVRWKRQLPSL